MQDNIYLLDTSFISALVNKDDPQHHEARAIFNSLNEGDEMWINHTIQSEILLLTIKLKELPWKLLHDLLIIFNIEVAPWQEDQVDALADFIDKTKYPLKPNDYSILFSAQQLGARLITFDKDLAAVVKTLQS